MLNPFPYENNRTLTNVGKARTTVLQLITNYSHKLYSTVTVKWYDVHKLPNHSCLLNGYTQIPSVHSVLAAQLLFNSILATDPDNYKQLRSGSLKYL